MTKCPSKTFPFTWTTLRAKQSRRERPIPSGFLRSDLPIFACPNAIKNGVWILFDGAVVSLLLTVNFLTDFLLLKTGKLFVYIQLTMIALTIIIKNRSTNWTNIVENSLPSAFRPVQFVNLFVPGTSYYISIAFSGQLISRIKNKSIE